MNPAQTDPSAVASDPLDEPEAVRGVTGTVTATGVHGEVGVTVVGTEPDGRMWSLQTQGLSSTEVVDLTDGLAIDGATAAPGRTAAMTLAQAAVVLVDGSYWLRLDIPALGEAEVGSVMWSAYLQAWFTGREPSTTALLEIRGPAVILEAYDWRQVVATRDEIVTAGGEPALLQADTGEASIGKIRSGFTALLWTTLGGGHASLSSSGASGEPSDPVSAQEREGGPGSGLSTPVAPGRWRARVQVLGHWQ
jgi:hypothetical protein